MVSWPSFSASVMALISVSMRLISDPRCGAQRRAVAAQFRSSGCANGKVSTNGTTTVLLSEARTS